MEQIVDLCWVASWDKFKRSIEINVHVEASVLDQCDRSLNSNGVLCNRNDRLIESVVSQSACRIMLP